MMMQIPQSIVIFCTIAATSLCSPLYAQFSGGDGDGHDEAEVDFTLTAYDMENLFAGGNGDGYDARDAEFTLTAYDPENLFNGGDGDGNDVATFDLGGFLPLTLVQFGASVTEKTVLLNWSTLHEIDTDHFIVEKSQDLVNFSSVGRIEAAGSSTDHSPLSYELVDPSPFYGASYYRLLSVDLDGTTIASDLRSVEFFGPDEWGYTVYPNPSNGKQLSIQLRGYLPNQSAIRWKLIEPSGRVLINRKLAYDSKLHVFDLTDASLPSGTYWLWVGTNKSDGKTQQVIIRRED